MTTNKLLAALMALMAPLLLWPFSSLLGAPFLVEELIKCCLIFYGRSRQLMFNAFLGLVFGISESFLYFFQLIYQGFSDYLPLRLGVSVALHTSTCLLMGLFALSHRHLVWVGLPPAVLAHYLYNTYSSLRPS